MGRVIRNWREERVENFEVAPHRYLHSGVDDSFLDAPTYAEFRAGCPYKEGEVVYVAVSGKAVRAKIYTVWWERDFAGFKREVYKVQLETAGGYFSKLWTKAWPGYIQRGYQAAGLAPDLDEADRKSAEFKARQAAATAGAVK